MKIASNSSAPHIYPAADWRQAAAESNDLVLYRSPDRGAEGGIRRWTNSSALHLQRDMLCYFQRGQGTLHSDTDETIVVTAGTAVHFKENWRGSIELAEALEATYMSCDGGPADHTPVLRDVFTAEPLKDWGTVPTMIEGASVTAGILLSREPSGRAETGIWTCTPGVWRCEVTSDEFCHFLDGSCTYTHDNGEQIRIEPDTLAFFPKGWKGRCEIRRTMRKVYMIR